MNFSSLDLQKTYTYADYLTWQFKERIELFKGRISKMSPAPSSSHQGVISNLLYDFLSLVRNKKSKHNCKIFTAPFDVRLPLYDKIQNKEITTVVQPDIVVVCDKDKIDERGCLGAPDLVVEVLSKSTAKKDVDTKFHLYEEAGVKEYWIVSPGEHVVTTWKLGENNKFTDAKMYSEENTIYSNIIEGLEINLKDVFDLS
ncbi:MAG: Uma2 family endonuclease [Bacteroidetes bacterium]|nr:MAG: Uma2 family endonuclease [Bacteroidota bacterium]